MTLAAPLAATIAKSFTKTFAGLSRCGLSVVLAAFLWSGAAPARADGLERLAPPAVSSPRATVLSFLDALNAALEESKKADALLRAKPALRSSTELEDLRRAASEYLEKAAQTLDLADIPPSMLERTKFERVLALGDVLRRAAPSAIASLPDGATVDGKVPTLKQGYTVPGTPVRLERSGENYLFPAKMLADLAAVHERAMELPPRDGSGGDAYDTFTTRPGGLVPPAWYGYLIDGPEWLLARRGAHAVWQWLGLAGTLALACVFPLLVWRVARPARNGGSTSLIRRIALPVAIRISAFLSLRAVDGINIGGGLFEVLNGALLMIAYGAWLWTVVVFVLWASDTIPTWKFRRNTMQASLTRTLIRVIGIVFLATVAARGLSQMGVPLIGIMAGLGLGGLALALAAQPTIENLIAGVMLYLDRPVRVGDECEFGGESGVIEEIGIRSTRIRRADGTMIAIPNGEFSRLSVRNVSAGRPGCSIRLLLPSSMSAARIEVFLEAVESGLREIDNVHGDSVRALLDDIEPEGNSVRIDCRLLRRTDDLDSERQRIRLAVLRLLETSLADEEATMRAA